MQTGAGVSGRARDATKGPGGGPFPSSQVQGPYHGPMRKSPPRVQKTHARGASCACATWLLLLFNSGCRRAPPTVRLLRGMLRVRPLLFYPL